MTSFMRSAIGRCPFGFNILHRRPVCQEPPCLYMQRAAKPHPPHGYAALATFLSVENKKDPLCISAKRIFGGDKRDRTADLMTASHALSRLDRLHTPLNRANRAFNTRDTPPKAAKPSAFFLKFIIAGARPHINTKFENKLDTAIPFSHGIISLFHSERGC